MAVLLLVREVHSGHFPYDALDGAHQPVGTHNFPHDAYCALVQVAVSRLVVDPLLSGDVVLSISPPPVVSQRA